MKNRRWTWILLAVLLFLVGSTGSIIGARTVAQNDHRVSLQAFSESSANVGGTLRLALQREQDLSVSARSFFISHPDPTQAQFLQWVQSMSAFGRYPELMGLAELKLVPASALSAFIAAKATTSPTGPTPAGTFQIVPPGNRPYYCLLSVSESAPGVAPFLAGLDYCQTALGPKLLEARDLGQLTYLPFGLGAGEELVVGEAVYSSGTVPPTVAARQTAFLGWAGTQVRPAVVLAEALKGHRHTGIVFHYRGGSSNVTFRAGTVPAGATSTSIDLHNGWHVTVLGTVAGGTVIGNIHALLVLLTGVMLFFVLAILIFVLGTGRARAVVLVHERTGELRHQAFHDPLTGLPNRALILDRLSQMLARARRDHTPVAVLFLDLDNFKNINDTLGHGAGDQLLVGVSARLSEALREGDSVGRLGGDEFVVLVEGASLGAGPEVVAERILDVLGTPFKVDASDTALKISASIGIAEGERDTPDELLRDADIALYQAKDLGKHRWVAFSTSMRDAVVDQQSLELDLSVALDGGQFFLQYQPVCDLSTGAFNGVEALLRWNHPERGVLQPNSFIPALESTGMIVPVGRWVLEEACRQGWRWQCEGHRLSMSVNVSPRQLGWGGLVSDVSDALSSTGFDPELLVLELTETTLMKDVGRIVAQLELLKEMGVRIAVDDFGTGYSSMAYLQQFPIDVLKIDQSFVAKLTGSTESTAVVHALVQLGKALGIKTVAEGIETSDQLARLEAEDVDNGQGFLFAQPMDVEAIDRYLEGSAFAPEVDASATRAGRG